MYRYWRFLLLCNFAVINFTTTTGEGHFQPFFFLKNWKLWQKKKCDTSELLIWRCLTIILGINFYLYVNIAILAFVVTVRYTFHEFIAFKIFLLIIFSCYDQVWGLSITSPFSLFLPGNIRIRDLLDN